MNILGNVILLFGLFPSFGHQNTAVEEKPQAVAMDTWGYTLPQYVSDIRNVHPRLFRMENGDVLITYVAEPIKTLKADGTCCDDDFLRQGIEFFSGKTHAYNPVEYEEFYREAGTAQYSRNKKIQMSDGATIEVMSNSYNCYQFVNASLVKKDRDGHVLARKVLFYKNQTLKSLLVDESCGTRAPRAAIEVQIENIEPSLVKLDENNFLIYEPSNGNLVVRFDANLHTRFQSGNLLMLDYSEVEALRDQLLDKQQYSEQAFHDSIMRERVNSLAGLSHVNSW